MCKKFSIMGITALAVTLLIIFALNADAHRQRRQYTQSQNDLQNDFQDFRRPRPNRPFRPNRPNRPTNPPSPPSVPSCDFGCGYNYEPVCALFGQRPRTFSNLCALDLERCRTRGEGRFLYRGECN